MPCPYNMADLYRVIEKRVLYNTALIMVIEPTSCTKRCRGV